ncbi:MAG: response regulator transcription factor [Bacteroidales bacterium]|nr:response regulator transcription factor [Bacteroidales bacterium]
MKPIRLFLVDDHKLFRTGIKNILSNHDNFEIVGEAASGEEFFLLLHDNDIKIDILLLDIILPDMSGVLIADRMRKEHPCTHILVLSSENKSSTISQLVQIGIDGFIDKNAESEELIKAFEIIADGGEYYGRDIARIIHCIRVAKNDISDSAFTPRELGIIELCVKGLQAKEIAAALNISTGTVNTHKNNIFKKLGINNSVELVNYCISNGIVKL